MKCSFDSTGTLENLLGSAILIVALSVSLLISSIGYYYKFSTLMAVSAIIFTVSAAAAFVLYIIKGGKKIKLCVDLNIPEDKPMCDPDGYKRFINDQPIMKLCRYINEKSR